MPNWCANTLIVTGPCDLVQVALDAAAGADGPIDLNTMLPVPPYLLQERERPVKDLDIRLLFTAPDDPADDTAYAWRVREWGTKWTVEARIVGDVSSGGTRTVTFAFDSAWSPPLGAVGAWAGRHPGVTVTLHFDEPGNDAAGTCTWQGGQPGDLEEYDSPSNTRYAHPVPDLDTPTDLTTLIPADMRVQIPLRDDDSLDLWEVTLTPGVARQVLAAFPPAWGRQSCRTDAPVFADLVELSATREALATGWFYTDGTMTLSGLLFPTPSGQEPAAQLLALADGLAADDVVERADGSLHLRWDADL